jgi:hypothetical protein
MPPRRPIPERSGTAGDASSDGLRHTSHISLMPRQAYYAESGDAAACRVRQPRTGGRSWRAARISAAVALASLARSSWPPSPSHTVPLMRPAAGPNGLTFAVDLPRASSRGVPGRVTQSGPAGARDRTHVCGVRAIPQPTAVRPTSRRARLRRARLRCTSFGRLGVGQVLRVRPGHVPGPHRSGGRHLHCRHRVILLTSQCRTHAASLTHPATAISVGQPHGSPAAHRPRSRARS